MKRIFTLIFVFVLGLCFLTSCKDEGMIERADGFTFNEQTGVLSCKVSNDTAVIDLTKKIDVTEGYTWEIFSDKEHKNQLDKTKLSLVTGENTVYFMLFDDGEEYAECTIRITRSEGLKIEEGKDGLTGSIDIEDLLG